MSRPTISHRGWQIPHKGAIRGGSKDIPDKGGPGSHPVCWPQLLDWGSYGNGPAGNLGLAHQDAGMLGECSLHSVCQDIPGDTECGCQIASRTGHG